MGRGETSDGSKNKSIGKGRANEIEGQAEESDCSLGNFVETSCCAEKVRRCRQVACGDFQGQNFFQVFRRIEDETCQGETGPSNGQNTRKSCRFYFG